MNNPQAPNAKVESYKQQLNAAFGKFTKNEWHQFIDTTTGKKVSYSASKFLTRFKNPFDEDGMSKRVAAKRGVPQQVVLDEWHQKRDASLLKGNQLHTLIDQAYNHGHDPRLNTTELDPKLLEMFNNFYNKNAQRLIPIALEKVIASSDYMIGGVLDALFYDQLDDKVYLIDWKTNGSIDVENKYNAFMLECFQDIPDVSFYHYSMQLSVYKYILTKETTIPIDKMFIAWFNECNDAYKIIPALDYADRLSKVLAPQAQTVQPPTVDVL